MENENENDVDRFLDKLIEESKMKKKVSQRAYNWVFTTKLVLLFGGFYMIYHYGNLGIAGGIFFFIWGFGIKMNELKT